MIDLRGDNAQSDNQKKKYGNLNIPVTAQPGTLALSPYLNFDPTYLPSSQPEFIFPEGVAKQRGRFELAFGQIGAVCMTGAVVGGVSGIYRGMKATSLAGHTGKLRTTQLINHAMKSGSSLSNTLGIVSVMYTSFGIILSWARGTDDSINTLAAATATGMLFKSTNGLRKCAMAGSIGFGLASLYCLWNFSDQLAELRHRANMNPASK